MIRKLFVFSLIAICSCSEPERENEMEKNADERTEVENTSDDLVMVTTEMPIIPFTRYQDPFYSDSTLKEYPSTLSYDKSLEVDVEANYQFNCRYPQSKKHEDFNVKVKKLIDTYFEQHLVNEKDGFFGDVNAEIVATDFSYENDFVSVLFTEQDYYHGAAHYNHGYLSLNYDLKKNKEIKLTDLVLFKNGEAQKFCDAFNPDPATTIHEIFLEGKDFTKDRPFMVNYGELVLYFSDYEKGPSMTKVRIPYSKIRGYVNPAYQILFQ